MTGFLTVLLVVAMLATLGVLVAGMIGMVRGASGRTSNKLMRMRVLFQGIALAILAVLLFMLKSQS